MLEEKLSNVKWQLFLVYRKLRPIKKKIAFFIHCSIMERDEFEEPKRG